MMQCSTIFCLLGWSPGDDIELFDSDFAISKFDLNKVLPNSATFDEKNSFG